MAEQRAETDQKRGHHLTVVKDDDFDPEYPHFKGTITCLVPTKCGGWQECPESHQIEGGPVNDGPWDSDEDAPWFEEDYFTFHGVEHEWRYGYGWTVPFEGCCVADNDSSVDSVHDIGLENGEGTYVVDDEWDDTSCTLIVVERVSSRPAQAVTND
ncbi:hypothetical protein [Nocardioides soli]|uniref:Uncharacterized protein n=1 Tax=Nocardioides soli TaxID=1036020 RepID=A0A7W4YZI5_9ACTN|nr:hypothetical protein [Nocardioides soli]MBB3040982.1 hypothetical protein [Nocardioides soli]